jgi:glycosyltransferase involved in cell wall biosynthesis
MRPPLTIGLPVYNGEKYLRQSLDTLLAQSFGDFELIIADNASTDGTAGICREYAARDSRVRYIRHPRNIGSSPNHCFVVDEARGELFKWASDDDLYADDLLRRCVGALAEHPEAVLAHSWTVVIDESGRTIKTAAYDLGTDSPSPPQRFAGLLFASGGDDFYGVMRTAVVRRIVPQGSYHHSDRSIVVRLALQGPFYQVPGWLYFRREHPERASRMRQNIRDYCTTMDPRRGDRMRHPMARLYGEYVWSYIAAIRDAELTSAERSACYRHLGRWLIWRGTGRGDAAIRSTGTANTQLPSSVDANIARPHVTDGARVDLLARGEPQ